ncbi:MAG: AlpA family phage regulatory protein [Gammaproteobacteria bacterium]
MERGRRYAACSRSTRRRGTHPQVRNQAEQIDAFPPPADQPTARRSPTDKIRVLRLPEVCEIIGLCRSSIYQMEAERRFPCRIKIGARSVGWIESEIQTWLRKRIEAGRPAAP